MEKRRSNFRASLYIRLSIIELKLGRINYALSWWEFACIVDANLEGAILTEKEHQRIDAYLSQYILNADLETFKCFSKLPDLLDKYQLFSSRAMLLYALVQEDVVKEEYELKIDQEYISYLKIVRDTDLGASIPILINCDIRYSTIETSVMGTLISVSFPLRSPLVELAETLLSVIEGFFSTGMIDQVFVYESRLEIEITADDDDEIEISHEVDDAGGILKMSVLCSSFTPNILNVSGQKIIQDWLHDFVIDVFSRMVRPKNPERTLDSMLGEDRALERSVSFGACFVGLQNIMGNDAVNRIKSLLNDTEYKRYDMLRSQSWDFRFPKPIPTSKPLTDLKPGKGEPPGGLMIVKA